VTLIERIASTPESIPHWHRTLRPDTLAGFNPSIMTSDLSILQLSLLALAAPVVVFNWGGFFVNLWKACRGSGRMVPTIYLASAILMTAAWFAGPRPECRWMFMIPLSDLANLSLPLIVAASIPGFCKRIVTRRPA
jgi:hypothetical protein